MYSFLVGVSAPFQEGVEAPSVFLDSSSKSSCFLGVNLSFSADVSPLPPIKYPDDG